jgi:hypothetical protein
MIVVDEDHAHSIGRTLQFLGSGLALSIIYRPRL